jgi:diacylglycerol kinase (ATP)
MSFSRVAIIFNPQSTGDAPKLAEDLRAEIKLRLPTVPVNMLETERPGHAEKLAREFASGGGLCLAVSVSGDGGYNEVINGVLASSNKEAAAAVVPAGNANDHSTAVSDPAHPLIYGIAAGLIERLDVLEVVIGDDKPRYAHSYVGLGLTPAVAQELSRHKLGRWGELVIVLHTLRKLKPFVISRGGQHLRLMSLVAANIDIMAKYVKTRGNPQDGFLDLLVLPSRNLPGLLFEALRYVIRGPRHPLRLKEYRFKTTTELPIQMDGEVSAVPAGTEVTIQARHRWLRTVI